MAIVHGHLCQELFNVLFVQSKTQSMCEVQCHKI